MKAKKGWKEEVWKESQKGWKKEKIKVRKKPKERPNEVIAHSVPSASQKLDTRTQSSLLYFRRRKEIRTSRNKYLSSKILEQEITDFSSFYTGGWLSSSCSSLLLCLAARLDPGRLASGVVEIIPPPASWYLRASLAYEYNSGQQWLK